MSYSQTFFLCLSCFLLACNSGKILNPQSIIESTVFEKWEHSPMLPAKDVPVEFSLNASDENGIKKIELFIYEYELYVNEEGLPSKRKKTNGTWGMVNSWSYEEFTTNAAVDYKHQKGFADFANVEYIFRIINKTGFSSDRLAIFDAGESKWEKDKISLYATSRDAMKNRINICFVPDTDYDGEWEQFVEDVEKMIYDGFHKNNKIAERKDLWNFYCSKQFVDGRKIMRSPGDAEVYPKFLTEKEIQGIDAFGLVHATAYSDGALLDEHFDFLIGNMFTTEAYNLGTAVHEAAHAIFKLSDEYDQCACFHSAHASDNMFSSEEACMMFNKAKGFVPVSCTKITDYLGNDWFMSEQNVYFDTEAACKAFNSKNQFENGTCDIYFDIDGNKFFRATEGLCIMQDDGDDVLRDFQRTCASIIDEYYENLDLGEGDIFASVNNAQNIFSYEPVVVLEFSNRSSQRYNVKPKAIQYGVPDKSHRSGQVELEFLNASKTVRCDLQVDRPGQVLFHQGGKATQHNGLNRKIVTIPYFPDLNSIKCKHNFSATGQFTIKGVDVEREESAQEFSIQEELRELYRVFQR